MKKEKKIKTSKKEVKKNMVELESVPTPSVQEIIKIIPLVTDFGREDLNLIGNKINELVERVNNMV